MALNATLISSFPAKIFKSTDKVKRDQKVDIDIRSIIVFNPNLIVLSDFMHGIKSFDATGTPLCKLRNPSPSTAMTKMSDSRLGFLIPFDSYPETVLVDVDLKTGELSLFKRVHTEVNYRAIAAMGELTWINAAPWWNGAGKIDQININGEILTTYDRPGEKQTLLESPICMTVAPSGQFIVADENAKKIFCIDPEADNNVVRFEFNDESKLQLPFGVCCDNLGRIYVTDHNLNHVIMLSSDGEFLQTIVGNGELCKPTAVYVLEDKLYVVERDGCVMVFQLSQDEKLPAQKC